MEYGCIGEHLGHSFSKEIHNRIKDYPYDIREVARKDLAAFMTRRDFRAINVTIPYKQDVIPYLYYVSDRAREIGAVNTVVNRGGKLYGYNTDFMGLRALILRNGMEYAGKKVLIAGTGGTSLTAAVVARSLGASEVYRLSRNPVGDAISYEEAYRLHGDASYLINTTPVGMFPHVEGMPVDLDRLPCLRGVIDAVYNPLRSDLVSAALARGIPAEGGLYMLVAQAVFASEIFLDTTYPSEVTETVFRGIWREKENIVLTGMPASGKSTVGKRLAAALGREFTDTDALIVEKAGMEITEIFRGEGEAAFRERETEVIRELSGRTGLVIATGGGAVLRPQNIHALRRNGRLYFLDRSLEKLLPTADRPLASSAEAIRKRYDERIDIYRGTADVCVDGDGSVDAVAEAIMAQH